MFLEIAAVPWDFFSFSHFECTSAVDLLGELHLDMWFSGESCFICKAIMKIKWWLWPTCVANCSKCMDLFCSGDNLLLQIQVKMCVDRWEFECWQLIWGRSCLFPQMGDDTKVPRLFHSPLNWVNMSAFSKAVKSIEVWRSQMVRMW